MTNTLQRTLSLSFSLSSHPLPISLPSLSEVLSVFDLKPLLCLYTVSSSVCSQGLPDPRLQNASWQSVIHQMRRSLCTSINNWAVLKMARCRVSLSWGDFIPSTKVWAKRHFLSLGTVTERKNAVICIAQGCIYVCILQCFNPVPSAEETICMCESEKKKIQKVVLL